MNRVPLNVRSGFTLVEILIAIFIFAVLTTSLFSSFNTFVSSSRAVQSSIEDDDRIRLPLEIFLKDLTSIVISQPPRYNKPSFDASPDPFRLIGEDTTEAGQTFSKLDFTSLNHIILDGSENRGVARIVYYVRQTGEDTIDLCRSDSLQPYENKVPSQCDPIVLKDISRFDIRYYDRKEKEHKHWDSESSNYEYTIPDAVKFTIGFKAHDREKTAETIVKLPVKREVVN